MSSITLKQNAYRFIRKRLLSGRLAPGGRVSELALSKEMGTSRAPVREAIRDLIADGLIEQVENVGTFVKKPSRTDLIDLYEIREWLECEAVAKATSRITGDRLNEMEQVCYEMEQACAQLQALAKRGQHGPSADGDQSLEEVMYQAESFDAKFHLAIIGACGNHELLEFLTKKHVLSRLWSSAPVKPDATQIELLYREHCQILEAMRCGDGEGARHLMRQHIRKGRDKVLANFDRQQQDAAIGKHIGLEWPQTLQNKIARMEDETGR